jgi:hypothetical protein
MGDFAKTARADKRCRGQRLQVCLARESDVPRLKLLGLGARLSLDERADGLVH